MLIRVINKENSQQVQRIFSNEQTTCPVQLYGAHLNSPLISTVLLHSYPLMIIEKAPVVALAPCPILCSLNLYSPLD